MEATGVYWKPVVNLFEAVWVVNPSHIKGMPGRKTDVQDSQWIAHLLRLGVLKGSYIPDRPQRELREVVRYRKSLIQARATEANRIQKVLEGSNIKLARVILDVLRVSGQRILAALADGETESVTLVRLADARIRALEETLAAALRGLVERHQQRMLKLQLAHIACLDRQIVTLNAEIGQRLANFDDVLARLQPIPGVGHRTTEPMIAEVGTDMHRVPSARQLVSWAGFSPAQKESAGKRQPAGTRKGSKAWRAALVESGQAAGKTRTDLGAVYRRLAGRRGKKRAAVAVGRHSLTAIYAILKTPGTVYHDLGADDFDQRDRQAIVRRETCRLEALGYRVTVAEVAATAS
jgi:transposase